MKNINNFRKFIFNKYAYQKRHISLMNSVNLASENKPNLENTDPIFEKYNKFLKDLSERKRETEKIYSTNFGSIRLDSDNEITNESRNSVHSSSEDRKSNHTDELNYIDDVFFREDLSIIDSTDYGDESNNSCNISFHDKINIELPYLDKLSPKNDSHINDLNYIDDLYFKEELSSIDSSTYINRNSALSKSKVENTQDIEIPKDLNLIDSQYMINESKSKSLVDSYEDISVATSNFVDSNFTCDPKISSRKQHSYEAKYSFEDSLSADDADVNNISSVPAKRLCSREDAEELFEKLFEEVSILFPERRKIDPSDIQNRNKEYNMQKQLNSREIREDIDSSNEFHTRNFHPESYSEVNGSERESLQKLNSEEITDNSIENIDSREPYRMSAFEFVKKKRKEEMQANVKEVKGEILPGEKYKRVILEIPRFTQTTQHDMVQFLKRSILYNNSKFVFFYHCFLILKMHF